MARVRWKSGMVPEKTVATQRTNETNEGLPERLPEREERRQGERKRKGTRKGKRKKHIKGKWERKRSTRN